MRKLIMWNLVTLDGYFEGPKSWDLDWHEYAWGEELERIGIEQLKSADALLFGRRTYQGMADHWPSATGETADLMNSIAKVVFSNSLENATWNNTRLVKGPAEEEVGRLKMQSGKNLLIFGSAELSASLTRRGLIDEYRLVLVPIILGSGSPMFKTSPDRVILKLVDSKPLKSGGVILRYWPEETS